MPSLWYGTIYSICAYTRFVTNLETYLYLYIFTYIYMYMIYMYIHMWWSLCLALAAGGFDRIAARWCSLKANVLSGHTQIYVHMCVMSLGSRSLLYILLYSEMILFESKCLIMPQKNICTHVCDVLGPFAAHKAYVLSCHTQIYEHMCVMCLSYHATHKYMCTYV